MNWVELSASLDGVIMKCQGKGLPPIFIGQRRFLSFVRCEILTNGSLSHQWLRENLLLLLSTGGDGVKKTTLYPIIRFLVLFLFLKFHLSSTAAANEIGPCSQSSSKFDACQVAGNIAASVAQQLPIQISRRMVLSDVAQENFTLVVQITLLYDVATLDQARVQSGMSEQELQEEFSAQLIQRVCRNSTFRELIDLEGEIQITYVFLDLTHFFVQRINRCA